MLLTEWCLGIYEVAILSFIKGAYILSHQFKASEYCSSGCLRLVRFMNLLKKEPHPNICYPSSTKLDKLS